MTSHYVITMLFIIGAVITTTTHQVIMKFTSQHAAWSKWWLILMGIGYLIGIFAPLCQVFAFRGNNATVITAISGGILFPVLYLTLYLTFRSEITWIQLVGIVLACVAAILVQFGPVSEESNPHGKAPQPSANESTSETGA